MLKAKVQFGKKKRHSAKQEWRRKRRDTKKREKERGERPLFGGNRGPLLGERKGGERESAKFWHGLMKVEESYRDYLGDFFRDGH